MTEQTTREDTMLYRVPTPESAEVVDIWGKKLETRVVDASEVPALLKDGWVTNPLHIDSPPKPEELAGFVPDHGEVDALRTAVTEAKERETALAGQLKSVQADLAAAEELAAAESKAKEDALARVAELEAKLKVAATTTLTVKKPDKPA